MRDSSGSPLPSERPVTSRNLPRKAFDQPLLSHSHSLMSRTLFQAGLHHSEVSAVSNVKSYRSTNRAKILVYQFMLCPCLTFFFSVLHKSCEALVDMTTLELPIFPPPWRARASLNKTTWTKKTDMLKDEIDGRRWAWTYCLRDLGLWFNS